MTPTKAMFDYHMKLHYSQTQTKTEEDSVMFDYHMKLHYSQTNHEYDKNKDQFDYHMKLHYSQTSNLKFMTAEYLVTAKTG